METHIREYIRACEAYGWEGGPEFRTNITTMVNKAEKRNADWSQSRFFASLPFMNVRPDAYQNILDMFEDRMGRWGAFLYRNPATHVADDAVFGTGDGTKTLFQLGVMVGRPGRERFRNVYALYVPDLNSDGEASEADITVYVNGTPTTVTIDHDRGTVEFSVAPTNGAELSWSGPYSHWVRFDNDRLPFSIDSQSQDGYHFNGSVDLIGVLPPPVLTSNS